MTDPGPDWWDEVRRAVRDRHGLDLRTVTPTANGTSKEAFWVTDHAGTVRVLKVRRTSTPAAMAGWQQQVEAICDRLRRRGYPTARCLAVGHTTRVAFWLHERLPGTALDRGRGEPDPARLPRLLPQLIRLNDAQAGLGNGQPGWPHLLARTLTSGGDGYCQHATLRSRPDTRDLLTMLRRIGDTCAAAVPAANDAVHFDFNFANLLTDGTTITGVIDIDPPLLAGDRAFDLATMLFYVYDHDSARDLLRRRLLDLAGPDATRIYLAHMILRQVDWSLRRRRPTAPSTRRHLSLARLIATDIANPHT